MSGIVRTYKKVLNCYKFCVGLSWRVSKKNTLLQLLIKSVQVMVPVMLTWLTKEIVDFLLSAAQNQDTQSSMRLLLFVALLLALYILRMIVQQTAVYLNSVQRDSVLHFVDAQIARNAARMDIEYFDNRAYYDSFEYLKNNSFVLVTILDNCILCIGMFAAIISSAYMLFEFIPIYTILIIILAIPGMASQHIYTRKLYLWGMDHITEERRMRYYFRILTERLYAKEVRLFQFRDKMIEKYERLWGKFFGEKKSIIQKKLLKSLLLSAAPVLVSVIAIWDICRQVLAGQCSIGDFTLGIGLIAELLVLVNSLVSSFMNIYENHLKVDAFIKFEKTEFNKIKSGKIELRGPVEIEFRNVSFIYPDTDRYVLKDVSFHMPISHKLCIVGANGSGKSTLIKLLLRFYDTTEGDILLNGVSIKEYSIESIRKAFSCFFQDSINYAFTIRENIRISDMGIEGAEADQRERRAIELSNSEKLINRLPHREQTYITREYEKDGAELSGGENQKISLARAFYKKASVLLLDEPSANLDPKGEHEIFQALKNECEGMSMIFVSHRLSNVFLADEILVMDNGIVCATGKHSELLDTCPLYKKLFHYQADKYVSNN